MTTLADLTPEERAECVGMWCDFEPIPNHVIPTIIIKAGNDYDAEYDDEYEVFNAAIGHELAQPEQITPRYDIPRACNPDGTPPNNDEPKRLPLKTFRLVRTEDVSGVSGTGTVAMGVVFPDGHAAMRWVVGEHRSTVVWDNVESIEAVHGHGGRTTIQWEEA